MMMGEITEISPIFMFIEKTMKLRKNKILMRNPLFWVVFFSYMMYKYSWDFVKGEQNE